ncbi:unnamed protein product [Moneuplotes crassus]|uniref:FPL domain-containing protein n=1 Tax=Euplotes crassus TaxID=5936 RepID=A0AAD2D774_EUPCR|nr:unnamed protein product [Moneuplotes crassus]
MENPAFSPKNLRNLIDEIEEIVHQDLTSCQVEAAIENVRHLSEFLIYSKKKQLTYFEFFIEKKVLDTFSNILIKCNNDINIQLIQTMSILIQNIENEQDYYYLFSHSFLNKLISFNFDLSENSELVTYYISFVKMLSNNLNDVSVQFFFNKCNDFPLYRAAISLYNHSDPLVRTGARTITLNIYRNCQENMLDCLLSLPYGSYFPNLATQLMNYWKQIDCNLVEAVDFNSLKDELEDINDLLMYFQDIFEEKIPQITKALANSLLYYAYFPGLVGSIGDYKKEPEIKLYPAIIFFLNQTYNYIKEPLFINSLSLAIFLPNISEQFVKIISRNAKPPLSYRDTYVRKVGSMNLYHYAEENLSVVSLIERIINSKDGFLDEIINEYNKIRKEKRRSDEPILEDPISLKKIAIGLVVEALPDTQRTRIIKYHTQLSIALGRPTGFLEKDHCFGYISITDITSEIINSMYRNRYRDYVIKNKHIGNESCKDLIKALLSKDESLVLLLNSLFYTYIASDTVHPCILYHSRLYPIGKNSVKKAPAKAGEDHVPFLIDQHKKSKCSDQTTVEKLKKKAIKFNQNLLKVYNKPKYDKGILKNILNLCCSDPPFRQITFKFQIMVCYYLTYHQGLSTCLYQEEFDILANAYKASIRAITSFSKDFEIYQPFLDIFKHEYDNFIFNDEDEIRKIIKSPCMLVPMYDIKNQTHFPEILKTDDTKIQQLQNQIRRFLTLGYFLNKLNPHQFRLSLKEYPFNFEERDTSSWKIGQTIVINENYSLVMCNIQEDGIFNPRYIILDPEFFILAEQTIDKRGRITAKICLKYVLKDLQINEHPSNSAALQIGVTEYTYNSKCKHTSLYLYFKSKSNTTAFKDVIDSYQKQQRDFIDIQVSSFFEYCLSAAE